MAEIPADTPRFVLDTSALLTYFEDEAGADQVEGLLEQAHQQQAFLLVSFISFMEIFYITLREQGEDVARERLALLQQLPLICVESDPATGLAAGHLKAVYPLSLADCWVAALAEQFGAVLVHKDPEFEFLGDRIKTLSLPYKSGVV